MSSPTAQREALLQRMRLRKPGTGSDGLAEALLRLGVTHVYCVGGAPIDLAIAACSRAGLQVVGTRHQQGAAFMSLAHNYVAGGLASAVLVCAGPGATNCATGLLFAHDNRWPLLLVAARSAVSAKGGFQDFAGEQVFAPLAKWSGCVDSAAALAENVEHAARQACAGAPGAAYLSVTPEALSGPAPPVLGVRAQRPLACGSVQMPAPSLLAQAVDLLTAARRPALLLGKGVRWSEPGATLHALVQNRCMPFATSPMGRGWLSDAHALCMSAVRGPLLAEADCVVMVGARMDWTFRYGSEIAAHARIVRVDIDAQEAGEHLGRGVALHGDAGRVLEALQVGVAQAKGSGRMASTDAAWLAELTQRRAAKAAGAFPAGERTLVPMSPFAWLQELQAALPADALTVLDGNVVMTAAQRMLQVSSPVRRLTPGSNGCMGVGIPFAIGAQMARPDLPVLAIVGDFGLGLSAMELETAVRYGVPLVLIIANNEGPGGATRHRAYFGNASPERVFRFVPARHDLLMQALGGAGVRVEQPGQLGAAVAQALAARRPTCIDVLTHPDTALSAAI